MSQAHVPAPETPSAQLPCPLQGVAWPPGHTPEQVEPKRPGWHVAQSPLNPDWVRRQTARSWRKAQPLLLEPIVW